ncbi:hypothetical protein BH11PSE4_BH11PSE4_36360 [soil metagenome]
MRLSSEQLEQFRTEGWLFLPELFKPDEVALLRHEAEAIYGEQRPEVWREKSGAPRTAFAAHLYNEAFRLLGAHPRMIDPVEQIFGEKVYMHQYKINAKWHSPATSGNGIRTTAPGSATMACRCRTP